MAGFHQNAYYARCRGIGQGSYLCVTPKLLKYMHVFAYFVKQQIINLACIYSKLQLNNFMFTSTLDYNLSRTEVELRLLGIVFVFKHGSFVQVVPDHL